jgi:hypothetical protein
MRWLGHSVGIQKGSSYPASFSLSRASMNDASSVGGSVMPAFSKCSVL